jgi:DNA-binding response OmpR family regulator
MTDHDGIRAGSEEEVLRSGGLEVRPGESVALANGERLDLSVRELQLLVALARRAGRVLTREEIYAAVWREAFRKDERSVDVYISKLRSKLEERLPEWRFVHTHYGFGYRFDPQRSASAPPA